MNRVLIIEDDAVARRQLAQLFRFENFLVEEADCGQAGIAAAAQNEPDLVVCDIMMPGTDGFGVLQAVRKRPSTALTPFIFLTAKAAGPDVRQGMSQGADDYITKPFDPEALLASAHQRLLHRRLQRDEAERRASDTGMLAAAALPREMEGCLAQIETLSEAMAARYNAADGDGEIASAMKSEVARLRSLSQRLRLFSELPRLYAGRFSTSRTPRLCSPEIAVDTAHRVAAQRARGGDLGIATSGDAIPLEPDALQIMVTELVDNACKFSPAATRIDVAVRPEQACWTIVVADCGPGMLPQQVREIGAFKQFWSGPDRPGGLGLGLVLVQGLTRLYSGEFLVESQPGAGTRVSIMVPSE